MQMQIIMEGVLSAKRAAYRTHIRRQEVEEFKKARRRELMVREKLGPLPELEQTYLGVIMKTQYQSIVSMNAQQLRCHLQMLKQVAYYQEDNKFAPYLEETVVVLVRYCWQILENWSEEAEKRIKINEINFRDPQEAAEIAALTRLFTFIDCKQLFQYLVAVSFQIVPRDHANFERVFKLGQRVLALGFKDKSVVQDMLREMGLEDYMVQIGDIQKGQILTTMMNLTYSEEWMLAEIVTKTGILNQLTEWMETYGLLDCIKAALAGLYRNVIDYLCDSAFSALPQEQQKWIYNLNLPLFNELAQSYHTQVMQYLVHVSVELLRIVKILDGYCRNQLIDVIVGLTRTIVQQKEYLQECEKLFIALIYELDLENEHQQYGIWLPQFLSFILNNQLMVYHNKSPPKISLPPYNCIKASKVVGHLRQIIEACTTWVERCGGTMMGREGVWPILEQLTDLWCQEQMPGLQTELIRFIRKAMECCEAQVAQQLVLGIRGEVVLGLLRKDWQQVVVIQQTLQCLLMVIYTLQRASRQQIWSYFSEYQRQWSELYQHLASSVKHPVPLMTETSDRILSMLQALKESERSL